MRRVMCDNMRKHHLSLGLGLLLAVCALPTRAAAKPQGASLHKTTATSAAAPPASDKDSGAPRAKTRTKKRELPPCFARPIELVRQLGSELETRSLPLTYCDGRPNPAALDALSVLSRSRHIEQPAASEIRAYQRLPVDKGPKSKRRDPGYVAAQVMRLHEGLVARLQKVADRFPGKSFEIVSGHRPEARYTSRHHHGRALDFRVQGVSRERLRDFLRSFEATGVGYYPNSSFVHMDVREDKGYWVDRSGPGEAADYGTWPPPKREIESAQERILQAALADLAELSAPIEARGTTPARVPARTLPTQRARESQHAAPRHHDSSEPGDELTPAEVAQIRREALKALEALR